MVFSTSKLWWLQKPYYRIKEACSNFYYKYHKEVYICSECGLMVAPYVSNICNSLINDFGWHKLKNPKRWICHHCAGHSSDESFTKSEWEEYVKDYNKGIKELCEFKSYFQYMKWE